MYFGTLTFSLTLPIVELDVESITNNQTFEHTYLESVTISEISKHNGQGQYLDIKCGKYGFVLDESSII